MSSYVRPKLDPLHKSVRLLTLIGIFASYLVGLAPISVFAAPAAQGAATISGKVYNDFNNNGQLNLTGTTPETGVSGVTITVYDLNGNGSGSATSDSNGNYTITPLGSAPYRLEFTNLPVGYEPTMHGSQNGTSTQFITSSTGASNVNFGVWPATYGSTPQFLATVSHISGNPSVSGGAANTAVVHRFTPNDSGRTPTAPTLATAGQVGSVWGTAWQSSANRLFVSGFVKRHVGLGPQGLGGIYVINNPQGTPTVANFVDLDSPQLGLNLGTLPDNSTRGLTGTPTNFSTDAAAFSAVGKQGIGDIDLTEDEQFLWAVDLNNRALLRMNVANGATPTTATSYSLSSFSGLPACNAGTGVLRPWGLKFYNGRGYLGAVCTAETSGNRNDLKGYVLSFDPNAPTSVKVELTVPMTYLKGQGEANNSTFNNQWQAWTDTWDFNYWRTGVMGGTTPTSGNHSASRPMPMLSDIEFAKNGRMIIGFRDRGGDMMGASNVPPTTNSYLIDYRTGGDILCAALNGSTWQLESSGSCGGAAGARTVATTGNPTEFYDDDIHLINNTNSDEREIGSGGIAARRDTNEIVLTVKDPADIFAGGVRWLDSSNGASLRNYQIYTGLNNTNGRFGKAGGMGDVEILNPAQQVEIGNRVWSDVNGNGVQDANEPGLAGVLLTLKNSTGAVVATTTSDSDGSYYFTAAPNSAYSIEAILPNGYSLTTADAQAISGATTSNHAILDTRDSDALLVGTVPTINYTTGNAGASNHGLDFGFAPVAPAATPTNTPVPATATPTPNPLGAIGNQVWNDLNSNGVQDSGEPYVQGVKVELLSACSGTTILGTRTTDTNGYYNFPGLTAGQYRVRFTLPTGYQFTAKNQGTRTTHDSNANTDGVTDCITLAAGQLDGSIDAGLVAIAATPTPTNTPVPATATPTPAVGADIAITKSANVVSAESGISFNYLLTVVNNGPATADNVVVTDQLPAGMTVNSVVPSAGGSCSNTAGLIRCTWASLVNGASATVTINVLP